MSSKKFDKTYIFIDQCLYEKDEEMFLFPLRMDVQAIFRMKIGGSDQSLGSMSSKKRLTVSVLSNALISSTN